MAAETRDRAATPGQPTTEDDIIDRRRPRTGIQSPRDTLQEMPALVLLQRLPVPILAVAPDGTLPFASPAFADMLGHSIEAIESRHFHQVFHTLPRDESAASTVHAHAGRVVELLHADGSVVRASMSKSLLHRHDDMFALAVFVDLSEQIWTQGSRFTHLDPDHPTPSSDGFPPTS